MNLEEKPQFLKILSTLFGAHGKPLSESMINGYWKGLQHMSLVAFERVCDQAIEKLQYAERGHAKTPTVAELWDLKRGFRGLPSAPAEKEPEWVGDEWDIAANHLLLAYIAKARDRKEADRYAPDSRYDESRRCVVPGPITKHRTAILVKWKGLWARDMREDRAEGGKLDGKKSWFDCMSLAEQEIDKRAAEAA